MSSVFNCSFSSEVIFAAFYQFHGKILIPLMLENLKLWRTKSGIYPWNLKSLFHNVILLVILEFSCHVWFKKKRNPKLVPSTTCKRSLKQIKFSWKGNGRKGDSSMLFLYIRLLAILYIFAFVLVKASAPSDPLKSICWEVHYMKCFCQQSIEIDYLCIEWWQGCKANTEKGPHYTTFQKSCCKSNKLFVAIVV